MGWHSVHTCTFIADNSGVHGHVSASLDIPLSLPAAAVVFAMTATNLQALVNVRILPVNYSCTQTN